MERHDSETSNASASSARSLAGDLDFNAAGGGSKVTLEPSDLEGSKEELGSLSGITAKIFNVSKRFWDMYSRLTKGRESNAAVYSSLGELVEGEGTKARLASAHGTHSGNGSAQPLRSLQSDKSSWLAPFKLAGAQVYDGRSIAHLPVFNPSNKYHGLWSIFIMFLDSTYTAFIVPGMVAFLSKPMLFFRILDIIAGISIIIDVIVFMHCAIIIQHAGKYMVIRDGRVIALHYLVSWTWFIDLASLVPLIYAIATPDTTKPLQALRLLRLLRMAPIFYKMESGLRSLGVTAARTIELLFMASFVVNMAGCTFAFVAKLEGFENSWMAIQTFTVDPEDTLDLESTAAVHRYIASVYFALTTVSTVGYGDIIPKTTVERGVVMAFQAIGVAFFSYLIGSVSEILRNAGEGAARQEERRAVLNDLQIFAKRNNVPRGLQNRIAVFYEQYFQQKYQNNPAVRFHGDLPDTIWGELTERMVGDMIRKMEAFSQLPGYAIRHICGRLEPCFESVGHDIAKFGELNDTVYFLVNGSVQVTGANNKGSSDITAPAVLCQLAIFNLADPPEPLTRFRGYKARSNVTVFKLANDEIRPFFKAHPNIFAILLTSMNKHIASSVSRLKLTEKDERKTASALAKLAMFIKDRVVEIMEEDNGDALDQEVSGMFDAILKDEKGAGKLNLTLGLPTRTQALPSEIGLIRDLGRFGSLPNGPSISSMVSGLSGFSTENGNSNRPSEYLSTPSDGIYSKALKPSALPAMAPRGARTPQGSLQGGTALLGGGLGAAAGAGAAGSASSSPFGTLSHPGSGRAMSAMGKVEEDDKEHQDDA